MEKGKKQASKTNLLAADLYSCYQTAVSNIVLSVVVLLTLEFMTPLFKYTPNAILWGCFCLG